MSNKMNWVNREFDFSFPVIIYAELIERLKCTPSRLEALLKNISRQILTLRDKQSWSIQENAGHLITVESLFMGRLDDYVKGVSTLRPADVTGKKTDEEKYNDQDIRTILAKFRNLRQSYIQSLEKLEPEDFAKSALHPRLNKPMRLCDMLYFQVEHDEHHLAKIKGLINIFVSAN